MQIQNLRAVVNYLLKDELGNYAESVEDVCLNTDEEIIQHLKEENVPSYQEGGHIVVDVLALKEFIDEARC